MLRPSPKVSHLQASLTDGDTGNSGLSGSLWSIPLLKGLRMQTGPVSPTQSWNGAYHEAIRRGAVWRLNSYHGLLGMLLSKRPDGVDGVTSFSMSAGPEKLFTTTVHMGKDALISEGEFLSLFSGLSHPSKFSTSNTSVRVLQEVEESRSFL